MSPKIEPFWESSLQRALLFLARNPGSEFYDREVSHRTGVSRSAANYALHRLARLGWIQSFRKGRMNFYRASPDHPVIRQCKVLAAVIELEPRLAKLRPLSERVVLYGSAAQGRDMPGSDIDLLVITNDPERVLRLVSGWMPGIQPVVKDPVAWAGLAKQQPVFYREAEQGIVLWQRQ